GVPALAQDGDGAVYLARLVEAALEEPGVEVDAEGIQSGPLRSHHSLQGHPAEEGDALLLRRLGVTCPHFRDDLPGNVLDVLAPVAVFGEVDQGKLARLARLRGARLDHVFFLIVARRDQNRLAKLLEIA